MSYPEYCVYLVPKAERLDKSRQIDNIDDFWVLLTVEV